ncbi:MAG: GFA family protein [Pseudomonadota bacterium]
MSELAGACLCGAVTVKATPKHETTEACHCSMCRQWSAGPYIAIGCGENVSLAGGDAIGIYRSSEWAERVFCRICGTGIAWRLQQGGEYHVNAQLFAEAPEFPLSMQVFIDEKPASYSFSQETKTLTAAEIFAMFSADGSSS